MTTINVDTARACLRDAALRHCPHCVPLNTGIATGLDLDQAALIFAGALRRERRWMQLAPMLPGVLIGNVATLIVTAHTPPIWLIVSVALLALCGMIMRRP
jgi:hypothetical protein